MKLLLIGAATFGLVPINKIYAVKLGEAKRQLDEEDRHLQENHAYSEALELSGGFAEHNAARLTGRWYPLRNQFHNGKQVYSRHRGG